MSEELIAGLAELLAAERAGAHVAARTARELADGAFRDLMVKVEADEAQCCAMLAGAIENLGGVPSEDVGAFYEKAINIDDHDQRLMFVSRGQDWVVRKLDALIETVEDLTLLGDLDDMRGARVALIEEIDAMIEARRG